MNNLETEFKFRINKIPTVNFENVKKYYFEQTYFNGRSKIDLLNCFFPDTDFTIINTYRIRHIESSDEKNIILTIKSASLSNGLSRIEKECEISEEDACKMLDNVNTDTIKKYRYVDKYNGYKFEFDEYLNLGTNLYTVEVEVSDDVKYEEEVGKFISLIEDRYEIKCRDVTFNPVYKNSNLHKYFGK